MGDTSALISTLTCRDARGKRTGQRSAAKLLTKDEARRIAKFAADWS